MKLGMDFGTTTSATVAILPSTLSHEETKILCGDDEDRPVPSAIAIDRNTGKVFSGREASDRKNELSKTCEYIHSIKTELEQNKTWDIAARRLTPADIAGEIMKGLVNNVIKRTNQVPESMTVAVPVGFSPEKRDILRRAARVAGVKIDAFVSEPTAAFFAHYPALRSASSIAVFDWGGGTLDVSVLRIRGKGIEEKATAGLARGGDDLDREIALRIHNKFARSKDRTDLALSHMSARDIDKMLNQCERAKRRLGDDDVAKISIMKYGELGSCTEYLEYDWFADITRPFIDKAVDCLDKALAAAVMGDSDIDYLVMTGGSSNLRPLLERLEPRFGDRLYFPDETMWNVAEGAAMLAATPGVWKSAQNIDLILAGGARWRLLSEGDKIKDWSAECTFGITDASNEARLVIDMENGASDNEKYLVLNVPDYGFLHERIILKAYITQDQVLVIEARSGNRPPEMGRVWKFPKLRIYYELPEDC